MHNEVENKLQIPINTITEKMEIIFVCCTEASPQKTQFHLRLTHNISYSTLNPASIT